ncbi:MAG: hypothetical protein NG712_03175 [Omnitrophica bacterium]|nr:hypothetical protein [Candidatus Omnitrophota bacterium]
MTEQVKGNNTLWTIMSIISLLCAIGLLFFMLQERSRRIMTEERLSQTQNAKRSIEIRLDHARSELMQLQDKARVLAEQTEREKQRYQAILAELGGKTSQINELESNLTNEKKQRTSLANTLAQLRENYDSLEEKLKEAELMLEELKGRGSGFRGKRGVELRRIVVKPKKKLSGKVLVVNREFKFVVVDLGRKDGVTVGDEFRIYHGSEEIGKVQIEKVYDAMSTAAILPGSQEQEIDEETIVKSF